MQAPVAPPGLLELGANPRRMHCAAGYGLVQVHVSIANLDVEAAIWVGTHPRFVVDGRSLTPKVG